MTPKARLALFVLLPAALFAAGAQACGTLNLKILDTSTPRIGVFDENGKVTGDIARAEVVDRLVSACNEALGLIRIERSDGKSIWLDPLDVRLPSTGAEKPICVASNGAKPADRKQVVSSGAESDAKCPTSAK